MPASQLLMSFPNKLSNLNPILNTVDGVLILASLTAKSPGDGTLPAFISRPV